MVPGMSDDRIDPSGNTQQFQAFASAGTGAPEPAASRAPLVIAVVTATIVVLTIVAFLALS